jgi:hypothetical protein
MQTKRRYASELYPHAAEGEVRPLAVEVPYLYALAIGWEPFGTSWHEDKSDVGMERSIWRIEIKVRAREQALIADALLQGLTGDEAWEWAESRVQDPEGEAVYERARHYGVQPDLIKPFPCGPEPDHHDHYSPVQGFGGIWRKVDRVEGKESECPECCEPVAADPSVVSS